MPILQISVKSVAAATIPAIFARINDARDTGLDISSSTVPFLISRETVWLAQSTAASRPKSMLVAMELSTTSFNCSEKTKRAMEGKWPIRISPQSSIRK